MSSYVIQQLEEPFVRHLVQQYAIVHFLKSSIGKGVDAKTFRIPGRFIYFASLFSFVENIKGATKFVNNLCTRHPSFLAMKLQVFGRRVPFDAWFVVLVTVSIVVSVVILVTYTGTGESDVASAPSTSKLTNAR